MTIYTPYFQFIWFISLSNMHILVCKNVFCLDVYLLFYSLYCIIPLIGRLLYVSEGEPSMPPMLLPFKQKHNYTATIRVVVEDRLGTSVFVNVQFKVRMLVKYSTTNLLTVTFDEC